MATLNSFWEKPDGRHGRKEIEGKLLAQAVVLNNCVVAFGRNFAPPPLIFVCSNPVRTTRLLLFVGKQLFSFQ